MTIKTQFRVTILISIGFALVVAGILIYADRRIDQEVQKNLLADRLSKGVSELFMVTRSYLIQGDDRPRMQWELRVASLKKLIVEANPAVRKGNENLESISRSLDEMEGQFKQVVTLVGRLKNSSGEERDLVQEVIERLAARVTASGQEMVNHAFLLIEDSNEGLTTTMRRTIFLVMACIFLAIAASGGISLLLSRRILRKLELIRKGTEIVAEGNLGHRLNIRRDDEIGQFADAFDKMTDRLQNLYTSLEAEIAERTKAEERLRAASAHTRSLIEASLDPLVTISSEGKIMDVNKATELVTGISRAQLIGTDFATYFTEPERAAQGYREVFQKGSVSDYPLAIRHASGRVTNVLYNAAVYRSGSGEIEGVFAAARDITLRKRAEEELERYTRELERSNAELEQFAYVASHDLQEPLRIVASFTQLLSERYQGKLDSDADDFIRFAVDGANRMQMLINDLLEYSRVGTRGRPFEVTDCNLVLGRAIANLSIMIEDHHALVTHDDLPAVRADSGQLVQLFQNLIGNGIKYHGDNFPLIHISANRNGREWLFAVRDNGIGIDPQYRERIFGVFQRLHGRDEYSGTGIGLAICRKILDRHGGRIWVESAPGKGSTFYFTIPDKGVEQHEPQ